LYVTILDTERQMQGNSLGVWRLRQ